MWEKPAADPAVRTVLEQQIKERRRTLEEFAEYAETFAREHGEPGTLSVRHLQRLVAGARPDGRPVGTVRPATARLLERIFGLSIDELLAPPRQQASGQPLRVAVAIVVRASEVLIVRRRDDTGGITWQFPAGMVKPGAAPATVAVHETFNETGVHCVVSRDLGSRVHPATNVVCEYVLCDYVTGSARNVDVVENVDVLWADTDDLPDFIPASQIYNSVWTALHEDLNATAKPGRHRQRDGNVSLS